MSSSTTQQGKRQEEEEEDKNAVKRDRKGNTVVTPETLASAAGMDKGDTDAAANNDKPDDGDDDSSSVEEWIPMRKRRALAQRARLRTYKAEKLGAILDEEEEAERAARKPVKSLVDMQAERLAADPTIGKRTEEEALLEEEASIMESVSAFKPLVSVQEHATGVHYTEPMETDWRPPTWLSELPEEVHDALRRKWYIMVEGDDVPPPCRRFVDMRMPAAVVQYMADKGIKKPTPIQVQGLPCILSGRDTIGIAFTGSGKTLVFSLPAVCRALSEEMRAPLSSGEGPIAVILSPSRELAHQTYDIVCEYTTMLSRSGKWPELRVMLAIGGINMSEQYALLRSGVHIIVATPGRLKDMLQRNKINFSLCTYFALDEADRLIDTGFEEDMRTIISFFTGQRQSVLFSATMPKKLKEFAKSAMVKPVVVNVGRAGAASLDVIQEVEFVQEEARIVYLLEVLQKTPPPVLVFAEYKNDVDDIHEYLLTKNVEAVSIHGGKLQEERREATERFRAGAADVLVATDVAAKGLDFPDVQHVINFDMPKEIENYVHRIGRTGRSGKTGVATTFINKSCNETLLLDLKHLLREAKQKIPMCLTTIDDPSEYAAQAEVDGVRGCGFCGGLGHRVGQCPKLEQERRRQLASIMGGGEGGGGGY